MEAWDVVYARIRREYIDYGDACVAELSAALDELEAGTAEAGTLERVHVRFHKLAGSAGSYGFKHVSARSLDAELACRALVENESRPAPADIESLREVVETIRRELAGARQREADGDADRAAR